MRCAPVFALLCAGCSGEITSVESLAHDLALGDRTLDFAAPADAVNPVDDLAPSSDDLSLQPDGGVACVGPWSITHQTPSECIYPSSFANQRLPNAGSGGPVGHLMPNSDLIVAETMGADSAGVPPTGLLSGGFHSAGDNVGAAQTFYFATANDPVYRATDVSYCGAFSGPKDANGNFTTLQFHAPNGAYLSGNCGGVSCSTYDQSLAVFDQTTGKAFSFFAGNSTSGFNGNNAFVALPACPGGGHAGTDADPCPFATKNGYCASDDLLHGPAFNAGNGPESNSFAPYAAMERFGEVMSGHILHATNLNTTCMGNAAGAEPDAVFPAFGTACKCSDACGGGGTKYRAPNGALFFLDYTDAQLDCLNPGKAMCNGVAKLDALQFIFIEQLTHYGGYLADTEGGSGPSLDISHVEAAESYLYYEQHGVAGAYSGTCTECFGSFLKFMNAQCTGNFEIGSCYVNHRTYPPDSTESFETQFWNHVPPNLPGPTCGASLAMNNQCGVAKHLHIADPCIARTLAGRAGGC